jgi:hypothetical protein
VHIKDLLRIQSGRQPDLQSSSANCTLCRR